MSECSVNNNPLARISKLTQNRGANANLTNLPGSVSQQRSRQQQERDASIVSFKTFQKPVSELNKAQLNDFINGSIQQPKNTAFSPQYAPINLPSTESIQQPINNAPQIQQSNWSREFQYHSAAAPENASMSHGSVTPQQVSLNSDGSMYGKDRFKTSYQPQFTQQNNGFLQYQRQQVQQTPVNQTVNTNWDQEFKNLESELSENLNIKEENPDIIVEDQEGANSMDNTDANFEYQSEFQKVWDSLKDDEEDLLSTIEKIDSRELLLFNYKFDSDSRENPFLNKPNAYKIGCLLMENGAKLSDAALAFEAALKENSRHVDAWLRLGIVQIQNEKELNGIAALEYCLDIDPVNLDALENLAISYINEGYDTNALKILNRWVKNKYPNFEHYEATTEESKRIESDLEDDLSHNFNAVMIKKFNRLAESLPEHDAKLELIRGLLYYAEDDFDKTIECFKESLKINPNDEVMWNRLGASLANSNKPEDAIQASLS